MKHPEGVALAIIAAVGRNGAVGVEGRLPWRCPGDLRHFRATTLGHAVVLGRRTWQELGQRPLPGRPHHVVSAGLAAAGQRGGPGWRVHAALEPALAAAADDERAALAAGSVAEAVVFVLGGVALWRATWPIVDRVWLTRVALEPAADVFWPEELGWEALALVEQRAGEGAPGYHVERWERRGAGELAAAGGSGSD